LNFCFSLTGVPAEFTGLKPSGYFFHPFGGIVSQTSNVRVVPNTTLSFQNDAFNLSNIPILPNEYEVT
jgi:hypothetical protein